MARKTTAERFLAKLPSASADECWKWQAYVMDDTGYGQFYDGERIVRAHRFAYEFFVGPVAPGLVIDHTCHNEADCTDVPCAHRACCNPDHLEAVTQSINSIRGRSGNHQSAKTHCRNGHEYTPDNTLIRSDGRQRVCRECTRTNQARYHQKRKAA